MSREHIKKQFLDDYLGQKYTVNSLPADASFRSYERITTNNQTYILMDAPPDKETVSSFIKVGEFLYALDFSAPEILHKDMANGLVLLEDFGCNNYCKILSKGQKYNTESLLYHKAIDVLIALHKTKISIDIPRYTKKMLLNETSLLIDWYFPALRGEDLTPSLKKEYIAIWSQLLDTILSKSQHLVLRDYHAENLMWLEDRVGIRRVGLLDFQDAVIGPAAYDIVSLLEDARRDVGNDIAQMMINYYLEVTNLSRKDFLVDYAILGAQRNCKIIGIFARKALRDNNHHYLKLLPRVWSYILNNLNNPLLEPLKNWFNKTTGMSF